MADKLYPIDVFIYNHIKFFTEKGEGHCFQTNERIAQEINRHKVNVSRSISKLHRMGYISIDKSNGRMLSTIKDLPVKAVDNLAKDDDKIAMLVDILAMDFDNLAMDKLIISLRGVDNLAKHNIEFKLRYLNNIYNINNTPSEKPKTSEKEYAFEGDVIKLNQKDFDAWQKKYDLLDLPFELEKRDIWLSGQEKVGNWFISTKQYLLTLQKKKADEKKEDEEYKQRMCKSWWRE